MKKIVKIKESELVNLIDRIITESTLKSENIINDKDENKYFIVNIKNNEVISGWKTEDEAKNLLMDFGNPKNFKVINKSQLSKYETLDNKVNEAYDEIISLIRKHAKSLNDDDAFTLHEKLKSFFNKLI